MIEDENTNFTEWQKVPVGRSSGNAKISKKMVLSLPMAKFIKKLITELKVLKDRLYRVHMQFKAFKNAREQVLGPTYDKLCIPNFDLRDGNFIFLL